MKRFLKMTLLIVGGLIVVTILFGIVFMNTSPQFGAGKKEIQSELVNKSENQTDGVFKNLEETSVMTEFKWSTLKEYFNKEGKEPEQLIPIEKLKVNKAGDSTDTIPKITWFGHSSLYLEMEGKKIFIDPMLTDVSAPISFLGPKRFNTELPIGLDSIPELDVVLISHDHYDHLDYKSILKLKDKTRKFIVPLGVGAHLRSWGVDSIKITELDWWDSSSVEGIKFVATPSRHFSGRGLFDRKTTLWCSFVIQSDKTNLFFSGDGGYGSHFRQIGDKYGPFDLCFMECGQYNEQWAQIHLMPEQIVTATDDLKGQRVMPIHWGSFKLALHEWTEPVDRLTKAFNGASKNVITPLIGETVSVGEEKESQDWWSSFK